MTQLKVVPQPPPSSKSETIDSHVCPWLTRILYPLGSKIVLPFYFGNIEVKGQENVPRTGPVILAPTHRSRWDALFMGAAAGRGVSGRDLRFMVSANEIKGLQGWFIKKMGGFPVDPARPTMESLQHTVDLLKQGEMIVIFPEGNIFRQQAVHPLKRGVALAALQAQAQISQESVKIVPINISYPQAYPSRGCDVNIEIDTPLDVSTYQDGSLRQNSKQLTADLQARLSNMRLSTPLITA